MDYAAAVTDARSEDHLADRMRLDAFKLGRSNSTSNINHHVQNSFHSRSHSRSQSVSTSTLVPSTSPLLAPAPMATVPSPDSPSASPPPMATINPKRNSHHRRRSSVSTRRESAEIMGVTLPAMPASTSDDNINLGDKDSIRRRALWTLEGKTDVGSFSKVEIPELDSPQLERRFDFPTKPSYPPGIGAGYGNGLSGMAGSKRDSFGRFSVPCSSKEQLHTLMEEEEEDEDEGYCGHIEDDVAVVPESSEELTTSPVEVTITTPSPAPVRRRPTGLNLRPLSLASQSVVQSANNELPTPLATPSPVPRPGLKSLTLAPSPSLDSIASDTSDGSKNTARRRQSLILSTSPLPHAQSTPATNRRSSISYFPSRSSISLSNTGLPTPEMTPTSERRYSGDSVDSDASRSSRGSRSVSASEHHFLYQAHAALVQRISDLERALSARPRSRPLSYASDVSAPSEAPSDEMLQLVADLKAERDELKKDVDGWRTRVGDCERQTTLLMNRVETERREAWVARERMGLLEVEKRALESMLKEKVEWGEEGWRKLVDVRKQLTEAQEESQNLREELQRRMNIETECVRLATALAEEKKRREDLERELDSVLATPTPAAFTAKVPSVSRTMVYAKRGGLGFRSVDSIDSSCTDVESLDESYDRHELSLKVVEEVDEDDHNDANDSDSTEENELAKYEDEDENDSYAFQTSFSDSSFDSLDDVPREVSHLLDTSGDDVPDLTDTRSNTASPAPASPPQTHTHRHSLSKSWTFPVQEEHALLDREPEEIDRFFGCLDDVDNSPPLGSKLTSAESGKNLFSRALAEADDDEPPFVIPANVGFEVSESRSILDPVVEEDEEEEEEEETTQRPGPNDEFVGEEVDGGIIFTFSPPPAFDEPTENQPEDVSSSDGRDCSPSMSVDEGDKISDSDSFDQGIWPTRSLSRLPTPKVHVSAIPIPSPSTPVKGSSVSFPRTSTSPGAFSTPPPRHTSAPFILPPRGRSESPFSSTPVKGQTTSFIPQPRRRPNASTPVTTPTKASPKPRMIDSLHDSNSAQPLSSSPEMRTDIVQLDVVQTSPPSSISPMSPTMASLQKWTNLIPLPWSSPVLGNVASAAAASLCLVSSSSSSFALSEDPRPSPPTPSQARKYVPRQQQLQKLKARLEAEQRSRAVFTVTPQKGVIHV